MRKLQDNQILVARTTTGMTVVRFYQVMKSTSNTCEVKEIRKEILSQLHDEQEVSPTPDAFISDPIRRKVLATGCIEIEAGFHAWPWNGLSQWQTAIIFLP